MSEKQEAAQNGTALHALFSQGFIDRAARAAENSPWNPVVLLNAVAVYARRSSDVENQSIDRQDERSDDYARYKLQMKVSSYYSDEGISGETSIRPGLEALLRDARLGKFNILIIEDVDRVGRRFGIIGAVFDELEDLGIEVHSLFKQDKLLRSDVILKSLAATEHQALLRDRTGGGKAIAIKNGQIVTKLPFGYIHDPHIKKQYQVDPKLKDVIIWAFEARRNGLSCETIANGMKAMIADPVFHPPGKNHVERMLKHPIFKGVYIHGRRTFSRVNGKKKMRWNHPSKWKVRYYEHLRIVDDELWEAVGATFGQRMAAAAPITRLLSSKAVCVRCRRPMSSSDASGKNGHAVYQCRILETGSSPCSGTAIHAKPLESAALEAIGKVLATDGLEEIFQAMLDAELAKQRLAVDEQRLEIKSLLAQREKDFGVELAIYRKMFLEAQAKGRELPEFLSERRDKLANEIKTLGAKLSALPDLTRRILVTSQTRQSLLEVFSRVSNIAGAHGANYSPLDLVNIGLMRRLIERVDVGLIEGSRSHVITVHISAVAAVGHEGAKLGTDDGTRTFTTHAHRYSGVVHPEVVKLAFAKGAHFLNDDEFDLVWANFQHEIKTLGGELSRAYGFRRSLDLTAFIATTSYKRSMLKRCGIDTCQRALKLTRKLFQSGVWARMVGMLEREFPQRKGTFNPDLPRRFNAFDN